MTTPFGGPARSVPGLPNLPTPPTGWPVGSYATYEEAQRAVDHLADADFPVRDVTIVGVDLMLVERVIGRLSWPKVLTTGALSGAWFGLFVGLLLGVFSQQTMSSTWQAVAKIRPPPRTASRTQISAGIRRIAS